MTRFRSDLEITLTSHKRDETLKSGMYDENSGLAKKSVHPKKSSVVHCLPV